MIRDIGEPSVRSFAWKTAHGALWLPPFTPRDFGWENGVGVGDQHH